MIVKPNLFFLAIWVLTSSAVGQGTFVYDQQSNTDETPRGYGFGSAMQQAQPPWGQSFTPSLSGVAFIRLKFVDGNINDGLGATVYLKLRGTSISGPILGQTAPLAMPPFFTGTATFLFSTEIPVTPGVVYYFEPVLQSGGTWNIDGGEYFYPGGSVWANGLPGFGSDFWFREGILIPEPSASLLLLLGAALLCRYRRHGSR